MKSNHPHYDAGNLPKNDDADLLRDLDVEIPPDGDIAETFLELTRRLQRLFAIKRGLLAIREVNGTSFHATTCFNENKNRRNLSIRLPSRSSLIEKVAQGGIVYTESCCEFFSGSCYERNLLLDEDTRTFVLQPLKHEGEVVGIIGYSSDEPNAFTVFEEGLLDRIARQLAAGIVLIRKDAATSA